MTAFEKAVEAVANTASDSPKEANFRAVARAVLLAVRVPPSEVAEAGFAVTGYEENCDVSFTAMIDAILNEPPTKPARTDDSSPPQ